MRRTPIFYIYLYHLTVGQREDFESSSINLRYTKHRAYDAIRKHTGQDFGFDIRAWREWYKTVGEEQMAQESLQKNVEEWLRSPTRFDKKQKLISETWKAAKETGLENARLREVYNFMYHRPIKFLLDNLKGVYSPDDIAFFPREDAYEELKEKTKQDFGMDIAAWEAWYDSDDNLTIEAILRRDAEFLEKRCQWQSRYMVKIYRRITKPIWSKVLIFSYKIESLIRQLIDSYRYPFERRGDPSNIFEWIWLIFYGVTIGLYEEFIYSIKRFPQYIQYLVFKYTGRILE